MSISYSNSYSEDLLCCEDSGILSVQSPAYSSDFEALELIEESIDELIEDEMNFVPGLDYLSRFRYRSLDATAREETVSWMLKVQGYYSFQPLTAYLAVNYMDQFLYSRQLTKTNGWPLQLLSVACLSLAAKMEEPLVPSLLDLQVEGAKFVFEPKTVQRMELLVLTTLNWRLRYITPFNFLSFFTYKFDRTGKFTWFLMSKATIVILCNIQEASILEYKPSCIAVAALLCAANEIPLISDPELVESWCDGLDKEKIVSCHRLMQEVMMVMRYQTKKRPKVIPTLKITTTSLRSSCHSSSSSSPKRRKLNNLLNEFDDSRMRGDC